MDLALEDEFLARQLPHNLEAEQAVLGSMLIDQNCIKDVMDKRSPVISTCSKTGISLKPCIPCSAIPGPSTR